MLYASQGRLTVDTRPGGTAEQDLSKAGAGADQHTNLPRQVIRSERVEDQAATPGANNRSHLMNDKGKPRIVAM